MTGKNVNQYPALNVIVVLGRIIARILIVISLLGILGGIYLDMAYPLSRLAGLALLLIGFIGAVCGFFVLAYAESIKVIVDIEANTRSSAEALALIVKGGYNTQKANG